MRHILPILILTYIFFLFDESLPSIDRQKIKTRLFVQLQDSNEIKVSELPRWRLIANTNRIGRVLCIDRDSMRNKKYDLKKADVETWLNANLSQPNKVKIYVGNSTQVLTDAGLEILETEIEL